MASPNNPKLSAERIADPSAFIAKCEEALRDNGGNVQKAAQALKVSRRTLTRYVEKSARLQRVVRHARTEAEAGS